MKTTTRFRVLERDGFRCRYCGRRAPGVVLEVDHITPRAEGGGDDMENLVTSCSECNNGKRDGPLAMLPIDENDLVPEGDCCPKCTWCNVADIARRDPPHGYFAWYRCSRCGHDWRTWYSGDGGESREQVAASVQETNEWIATWRSA